MGRHSLPSVGGMSRGGIGVAQGAALTIGAVLGTGVISLPALGARIAGPASLVAWVALVALSVPLATTFAALGARYPGAGGVSAYVRTAFGDSAATAVGWCFYFAVPVGAPPAAMFAGQYVADVFGGGRTTTIATSAALFGCVAAMNWFGVRISGRVQLALTAVLAVLLLVTILAALPHADAGRLAPFAPYGWTAIAPAAAVLVWGFAGWEAVTSLTAEYRRPAHDIPRATGIALITVGLLYLGVVATGLMVLGPRTGRSSAPLADLLAIGLGGPARAVTAVIAVLLTMGAINAYLAGSAQLGAALAREGSLPSRLGAVHGTGRIPRRSLALNAVLGGIALAVVAVAGLGTTPMVLLTTGAFTLVYLFGTAAAVRLLRGWRRGVAAVALVAVAALLVVTGWHVLWALAVVAGGFGYTRLRARRRTQRRAPEPERVTVC
jgi:amino acid efflux transporter